METPENRFSELVDLVKSWLPQRPKPAIVSRAFWMPDHSCRVCYECDSQFTVFNRRHHCRLCGRVFCGRCTSNYVPISSDEAGDDRGEIERIRACNYCFKQWEQNQAAATENGNQESSPVLSTSPSAMSLVSIKSTGTGHSSNTYQRTGFNSGQSVALEHYPERQDMPTEEKNMDSIALIHDPPRNPFGFCINRSDDEEDEYPQRSDSDSRQFHHSKEYYVPVDFEVDREYGPRNSHPSEEVNDQKYSSSPQSRGTEFETSSSVNKMMDESGHESMCDCEASSSIYNIEGGESHHVDTEPVDFENNGLLWLPPEPEDEEEDRETSLFEDDEEDSVGEWGNLQSPNSFGCGEFQMRDRPSDDHRKAMKHVVDGHFRALISQLLQVENLPIGEDDDRESWLRIITSLSWEAATLLKPDTSKGDGMDPAGYLKIKCIARGRPSESMVIKGIVCKKNVAHRRMTARIEKARFLILGGALEYHRKSNSLSSVDTLLQQETDHLKMAVAKIDAQRPNVLLVEKSVSRFAQECLLGKGISLVLNIKRALLDRIARCTGAQVVPSVDNLSPQMLGHCDLFHVEKLLEEHGSAGQDGKKLVKTLMFFEGCPKPLGCTVLLKGASGDELKKVKHVIQYGVFAAYHLALETSFLADEGASLSELPLNSPIPYAQRDKPSTLQRSVSVVPGFTIPTGSIKKVNSSVQMVNKISDLDLTVTDPGQDGRFEDPLSPQSYFSSVQFNVRSFSLKYSRGEQSNKHLEDAISSYGKFEGQRFDFSRSQSLPVEGISLQEHSEGLKEDFPPSPSDHQSILVSLSTRCVWKGTVCERAHLFRIKYYGSFDRPLGRFLRDHLFDEGYRCRSCEMPSEAHVHCYTHRQGSLIISVKKLPEFPLTGEKDGKIWMWHRCLQCPRVNKIPPATRRVVMSDAAWGLSFGKFLELSFSNHAATSRVASCGHSLHRDCLRFYGFGKMVACFRYASIDVHSVLLPPSKLDFNHQHQDWVQREANEVAGQGAHLFSEVASSLQRISGNPACDSTVDSAEGKLSLVELQGTLQKEKAQFEESLKKIIPKGTGQPPVDILEVNKVRRQLLFQAYLWDRRLVSASSNPTGKEKINTPDFPPADPHAKVNGTRDVDLRGVQSQGRLSSVGADFIDHLGQPPTSGPVRRTFSEGQFSAITNISDSLDAKWTGEGSEPTDATLSDGQSGAATPPPCTTGEDQNQPTEDTILHPSLNESSNGFHSVAEHSPVHIQSFVDLERQAGSKLLLPVGVNDTVVPVYDDEPTSIIAWALNSPEYLSKAAEDSADHSSAAPPPPSSFFNDDVSLSASLSISSEHLEETLGSRSSSLDPLLYTKAVHIRVSVGNKYSVICYYGRRFEALRRACCPSETDFIRSLSRCKKWGAQGGKSNVFFAKTLDERFIIKQVTKTELESFIQFGPEYFKYLSESISTGSPTCLAKILGIYQVAMRTAKGGKETKMDVLVMENLLFGRSVVRVYDLKGSTRSRYNADSTGANKVLLDQNLIEAMPTSPIFVGNKAKRLLERAVWNDTAFLASVDVMDYSLLVGVDEERGELVLGIIDFVRQYTWDKHLETWVKASGILGGPKNVSPTVISPKQYKKRFRKAMSAYFLMVPDQWSLPIIVPGNSPSDLPKSPHDP